MFFFTSISSNAIIKKNGGAFYEETKTPISEHTKEQREKESPYNFCYFVLTDDREKLYKNIDIRVDKMLEEGLVFEVKALHEKGYTKVALRAG